MSKGGVTMKKILPVCFLVVLLISLFPMQSEGCFCSPFDGWHRDGDVYASGCDKALGDHGADRSYLYNFYPTGRGQFRLSFDFRNNLSDLPYVPGSDDFAFLDTFYATIFFVNSCSRFDLDNCSCQLAIPLFDLDHNGPFNVHGNIGPSQRGADWLHFDMVFTNYFYLAVPTFELFNLNAIDGDSEVMIGDVSISPVPIPGTIFLFGTGVLSLLSVRICRNFRKNS